MSKKREKRISQLNEEYEESIAQQSVLKSYESIENQELFMIDREGSQAKRRKVNKELLPKVTNTYISPTEKQIIQKYISKGFPSQTKKQYGEDIVIVTNRKTGVNKYQTKGDSTLNDVWVEEELVEAGGGGGGRGGGKGGERLEERKKVSKRLRVAFPGQSYHPNPKDHQNLLAEAVAMEMKLKEATNPSNPSSSSSMSSSATALIPPEYSVNNFFLQNQTAKDITNLFLMNTEQNDDDDEEDSDTEEESDDEDDDEEEEGEEGEEDQGANKKKRKHPTKLTRAQINRKKALRLAQYEQTKTKQQQTVNKSVDQLPKILKELESDETLQQFQTKMKKLMKRKKLRQQRTHQKAISLSERKQLHRLRSLPAKEDDEEEDKDNADSPFEDEVTDVLKPFEISSIPLSDELNSSLRKVIPKGVPVKDYMFEMIENGYMNPRRQKSFAIKDHPYLPKKVKWIPKYKY